MSHWLWIHQGSSGTEQALYCVNKQVIGFSGPSYTFNAHVILEHVDESGVKLAARMVVWRKRLAPLSHF